ncbi:cation diffusion facilitator 10 [Cordyceps fumosorosea ARSEF 2679]|uniref:Cation diffusion facilitator 10 n=1 Tax=Cordyceps fumosorosea (strain ARSEF 2679) TaxID=1081104 RepID=A0A167XF99_CORFA|nr:cation diffusion facilitator 10 [Cordyceps fumosorosea ARSEF 2679]OAA64908.1 cation diffusion facilitator 10 [Cordyceps fumosorosea ARSEF 2679]
MSSPSPRPPQHGRRPSLVQQEDGLYHSAVPTRTGMLTSMMRSRSQQSLHATWRNHYASDDDEPVRGRSRGHPPEDDELERLLHDENRLSQILHGPQNRSMNLIGKSNPRYRWDSYWKSEEELQGMSRKLREYYERTNDLIQQYMYIDCLLDSTIPHELLNEYNAELEASAFRGVDIPNTISEEPDSSSLSGSVTERFNGGASYGSTNTLPPAVPPENVNKTPPLPAKRTPKDIFRSSENLTMLPQNQAAEEEDGEIFHALSDERRPLLKPNSKDLENGPRPLLPWLEDGEVDSDDPIVTLAIYVNLIANVVLLVGKIIVIISVPSMSVLASLVDAVLDFLSTAIVWTTTRLIASSASDHHRYPVGRTRLEPLGVLVFSVIMVTSFCQVALTCIQRLMGNEHELIELGVPAITIMASTVVIKGACWVWCRMVRNSSVRALAEDAKTDVIFNIGSILFPIIGFYGKVWWLDATGGLLLSLVVVFTWSHTSAHHVRNLTGFGAEPDERNLLLYLTMRFATAIRKIQNLRAYHAGDKLFVEVDIVLSAITPLKDSHDLSEVLTYFLESVPIVDRAFVHVDYTSYNAPTHMLKQSSS